MQNNDFQCIVEPNLNQTSGKIKGLQTLSFTVIRKYLTNISLTLTNRFANGNREQVLNGLFSVFVITVFRLSF